MREFIVYSFRFIAGDGEIRTYVGSTAQLGKRMAKHRASHRGTILIYDVRVRETVFGTRDMAEEAERRWASRLGAEYGI